MGSLVGRKSNSKEAIIKDLTGKKIDSALKRECYDSRLALREGIQGAYTSQSLIYDYTKLFKTEEGGAKSSAFIKGRNV